MKLLMLAGLAALATPALAQTTPTPAPDPQMATPPAATPPATTDSTMPAQTAPMPTQTAAMPEQTAAMPADGAYPRCSRTVMDHCTERSNARGQRKHSTPRG